MRPKIKGKDLCHCWSFFLWQNLHYFEKIYLKHFFTLTKSLEQYIDEYKTENEVTENSHYEGCIFDDTLVYNQNQLTFSRKRLT